MAYLQAPPYDARAVANYFLDLASGDGTSLSPMKIQKLVYLAHGWTLALLDKPLIVDKVEAWRYGPVIRSLYDAFRDAGNGPIDHPAYKVQSVNGRLTITAPRLGDISDPLDDEVKRVLDEVWKVYGGFSAIQLSNYSHESGSPWAQTWQPDGNGLVISDDLMKQYFKALASEQVHEPA